MKRDSRQKENVTNRVIENRIINGSMRICHNIESSRFGDGQSQLVVLCGSQWSSAGAVREKRRGEEYGVPPKSRRETICREGERNIAEEGWCGGCLCLGPLKQWAFGYPRWFYLVVFGRS